jgi:hypothetical protein
MILKKIIYAFLILFFCSANCQVKQEKDSAKLYKNIQKYAKKSKFRQFFYKLIFEPVSNKQSKIVTKKKTISLKNIEGKIIRNINIETYDPFGFSLSDSLRKPKNLAERTANNFHIKTRPFAIKNVLLLKKNQVLDTILLKESERLIRFERFVAEVKTIVKPIKNTDSVDVFIKVLDSWSIIPTGAINKEQYKFELNERNFLGTGHNFDNSIIQRFLDGKKAYNLNYIVPNFKGTFIKTALNYQNDLMDNYTKSISFDRPFYSAFAKWAGGVFVGQQLKKDSISNNLKEKTYQNFKSYTQDFWLAKSFKINNGTSLKERSTRLILGGRYLNNTFSEKPTIAFDSIGFYNSEHQFLVGIGIASRRFVEDKYIFNYGLIEDVPIGNIIGLSAGIRNKNKNDNLYLGGQYTFGNYYRFGYLSLNFEVGSFFNKGKSLQTTYNFQLNYFSDLIEIGQWKMRQFFKPQFIIGANRLDFKPDLLSINDEKGIRGFDSPIFGTQKIVFTMQTQFFSPWNVIGFRLNPYLDFAIAGIGTSENSVLNSAFYKKFGVGFIISNDFLVFNSFQFSLSFYPNIPLAGENIFKTNAFRSADFGFQNFDFGKPKTVLYQ